MICNGKKDGRENKGQSKHHEKTVYLLTIFLAQSTGWKKNNWTSKEINIKNMDRTETARKNIQIYLFGGLVENIER